MRIARTPQAEVWNPEWTVLIRCGNFATMALINGGKDKPMKILLSGASGLIGSGLIPYWLQEGHQLSRLVRSHSRPERGAIRWDPESGSIDAEALEGHDAAVHLAGENIAAGRWNAARKQRILQSRVQGTRLLAQTLARLQNPPRCLVSASAIGFYGDRGDQQLAEDAPMGSGFLAEVCGQWEREAKAVAARGIRPVLLRIGIVLSARGGALPGMLLPFRLGLGGRLGSGKQYMSWIALDDLVAAVDHAIRSEDLAGPVNAVAPNPVTNEEFTRILGRVLSRPAFMAVPAFAARLVLGEMAEALLLASARVEPAALQRSGFRFRYPDLEEALRHALHA
jgi:uncharacterized protein (TIGR01777 family)